jgi:hypothetical protein
LLKPHLKKGFQFRGRGKTRDELSQEIARVLQELAPSTPTKLIWKDILERKPDLLKDISYVRFVNRVSSLRNRKKDSD